MKFPIACIALFVVSLPAVAQSAKPGARESQRELAIKRCRENRGTDCESKEGLREWLREERPITEAERQSAAAGRRHRENCARNKNAANC